MANLLNDNTHLVTVHNIQIMAIEVLADQYKLSQELRWEFGDIVRMAIQAEVKRRLGRDRTPEELHQAVVGVKEYWESPTVRERHHGFSTADDIADMLEEVAETIL